MDSKIYYFSGTGNSLAIAKQLSTHFGSEIIAITSELLESSDKIEAEQCVIVCPAYAYGLPSMMRRFFLDIDIVADHSALIVSYGTKYGAAHAQAKQILKKKGKKLDFYGSVKCVENYIPIFGPPSDKKLENRLMLQQRQTDRLISPLSSRMINSVRTFKPGSAFISFLFRTAKSLFARTYKVTEACTRCGVCSAVCPARAIEPDADGVPHFIAARCEHCQACLNWCPFKAIRYIRLTNKSGRYKHPDADLNEMKKR